MGESWQNRIVGYADVDPSQLLANPKNFRRHPKPQQDALSGVIASVGYVDPILVQAGTDTVIDGHLRVELAMRQDQPTIPVAYVDLTDAEADLILATFDPLSALAYHDAEQLDALLREVSTDDAAVMAMLDSLRDDLTDSADWDAAIGGLPDGEKSPFQQMTFTVSDAQAEQIDRAIAAAKHDGPFVDTGNENSNGNALARICETYVTAYAR